MEMTEIGEIINWCSLNISAAEYYIPYQDSVKQGGVGWAMKRLHGGQSYMTIDDEKMLSIFLLKFGHTGIKVSTK